MLARVMEKGTNLLVLFWNQQLKQYFLPVVMHNIADNIFRIMYVIASEVFSSTYRKQMENAHMNRNNLLNVQPTTLIPSINVVSGTRLANYMQMWVKACLHMYLQLQISSLKFYCF